MCTLTVVPHGEGFRAICNRDERETRPAADPPSRHASGSRLATYPTDPQSRGTWIGSNDAGLVLAILNRTRRVDAPVGRAIHSRGLIIPSLLAFDRLSDVLCAAALVDVTFFQPFQLLAVHQREAAVLTGDGRRLSQRALALTAPILLTSSSLGDELVVAPRRQLFEEMVVRAPDGWLAGQRRFHDHQWPERPHLSVRMQRPGARTVSRTLIDVRGRRIDFHYEALQDVAATAA